jgi:hypothetical protein
MSDWSPDQPFGTSHLAVQLQVALVAQVAQLTSSLKSKWRNNEKQWDTSWNWSKITWLYKYNTIIILCILYIYIHIHVHIFCRFGEWILKSLCEAPGFRRLSGNLLWRRRSMVLGETSDGEPDVRCRFQENYGKLLVTYLSVIPEIQSKHHIYICIYSQMTLSKHVKTIELKIRHLSKLEKIKHHRHQSTLLAINHITAGPHQIYFIDSPSINWLSLLTCFQKQV